jgi:hypothetical protein
VTTTPKKQKLVPPAVRIATERVAAAERVAVTKLERKAAALALLLLLCPRYRGVAMVTTPQLSEISGHPPISLYEMRREGRGPAFVKTGRHYRYDLVSVAVWLFGDAVEAEAEAEIVANGAVEPEPVARRDPASRAVAEIARRRSGRADRGRRLRRICRGEAHEALVQGARRRPTQTPEGTGNPSKNPPARRPAGHRKVRGRA